MTIGLLTRHPRRRRGEGGVVQVDLSDWGAAGAAEVTATCGSQVRSAMEFWTQMSLVVTVRLRPNKKKRKKNADAWGADDEG